MVRIDFLFIADAIALDFVNTEVVLDGRRVDLLEEPSSLARWIVDARLARAGQLWRVSSSTLAAAKRIRAALRQIAASFVEGRPVRRKAVAVIDKELRRVWGSLALARSGGNFSVSFEPNRAEADDPRFLIARAAASFLASTDLGRIRRCEGTNCILYFLDTTKNRTRRWCSMAVCGNRMKAALHYQRTRGRK